MNLFLHFLNSSGGEEELLNSTACPMQRKEQFFHGWGARSVLNGGSAQPRCQLWQAVPIAGWPYFKIWEPVLALKKVRSKQHGCATHAALHSVTSTMPLSHGLQQPCHPSPWEGTSTVFPYLISYTDFSTACLTKVQSGPLIIGLCLLPMLSG